MDPKTLLYNSLRYDLASFVAKVQNTLQPVSPYQDNWHIRAMTHKLQKCIKGDCKRLIITLPPRYLKSVSVSVSFVAYVLGLYPHKRIVCASYSADLALKNARECRQIMQEPWYRETFPHARLSSDKNTEAEFLTTKGGFRYTTSVGGTLTGRGGDIVIVDDVMKADDAMSAAKRDAARDWFLNTAYSRLDNKQEGIIIVVMQRLHQDDLVGHLMQKGGWEILNLPAIAAFEEVIELENAKPYCRKIGDVLHEAREPRTVLDKIEQEIGSYRFSAQYLQRPIPEEGEIIKFEWFKRYEGTIIPHRRSRIVQSWDTAIKGGSKNDFSVCTTWMVFNDEYFLLDVLRVQLAYPDLKKLVYEHAAKYPLVEVVIEDAGSGSILYDELRRDPGLTMDLVTAIRPDRDKVTRAAAVSVHIEAGKVWLPTEAPWLTDFYHELVQFPGGGHDDQIDSLVQFLRYEAGEKGNTRLVELSGVYRSQSREDWDQIRTQVMRWVLRVKLAQNFTKFSEVLLSTENLPIVEESRKDDFWGAKSQEDGTLIGQNVLGRLLMELREELKLKPAEYFSKVAPLQIERFDLFDRPIPIIESSNVVQSSDLFEKMRSYYLISSKKEKSTIPDCATESSAVNALDSFDAIVAKGKKEDAHLTLEENEFICHFLMNAPQLMWFLGAGTSRTAGMPTAADITWDLKRKYYCLHENQDIQSHDINNEAVKKKIQTYMDSKGHPALWSNEEYSFYFNLAFGTDYSKQQKYINDLLRLENISLNIGHRALAALLAMGKTRMIFTTNFDEVIETAFSEVTGRNLATFHLEGSYAALEALNAERFPIYAKVHGDFRYQSIKNLSSDLLENDKKIQECLVAGATRYGMVVSGYSGRDENVMRMFHDALEQNNPFPQGLFWTVTQISNVAPSVKSLIEEAKKKNVKAYIVETGTFDILLSKIWRQIENRPDEVDKKVRSAISKAVAIPLPAIGSKYPILRTNALPILECPTKCAAIKLKSFPTFGEMKRSAFERQSQAIITKTDQVLAWGTKAEISKIFDASNIENFEAHNIQNPVEAINQSTFIKSFYEEALARALVQDKPLVWKQFYHRNYIVIDHKNDSHPILQPLKAALAFKGTPAWIKGRVKNNNNAFWAEAISVKLEEKNGRLWLLLRPDIWVNPVSEKQASVEFLRNKRRYRYNQQSNALLDAWISILLGGTGNQEVKVSCFNGSEFPVQFTVHARSAFSREDAVNGA